MAWVLFLASHGPIAKEVAGVGGGTRKEKGGSGTIWNECNCKSEQPAMVAVAVANKSNADMGGGRKGERECSK